MAQLFMVRKTVDVDRLRSLGLRSCALVQKIFTSGDIGNCGFWKIDVIFLLLIVLKMRTTKNTQFNIYDLARELALHFERILLRVLSIVFVFFSIRP